MKYLLSFLCVIFLCASATSAQQKFGIIEGKINHNGRPVPGVSVGISSLQIGDPSDEQGYYQITRIPAGTYVLQVSAVGYKSESTKVNVKPDTVLHIDFELEQSLLELDQLVVTGTMRETYVKDSPVKVSVISNEFLQKNPSSSLMDNINFINGLYEQVSCGVCGTNDIRINGMDGPYTSVLIDGMPIMGALASVYGLNGINPAIIQTIEIVKGPSSTLYGSEAMGGVINIRTVDPESAPHVTMEAYGTTHEEANLNLSLTHQTKAFSTVFSGNGFYFDRFLDENKDLFADITKRKRISLFNRWSILRPSDRIFNVVMKYYAEDRLGGTPGYSKAHRGSREVYGEAINTNRFELLGSYELPVPNKHIRADFSYSYHAQDSYYGDYHYTADQRIFFTNLIWDEQFSPTRQLLLGSTIRYDLLDQTFDKQRLEDGSKDNRFIPGLFAQYEHIFNPVWRGLIGLRADHYKSHGIILSPRLNLKISATDHTTFRLNTGTGFRIVNLFTEEHEALTGSRRVVIAENLDPERSYNLTLNINQIIDIGVSVLNVDLDLFHTHFANQIIPDYSTPNEIRYSNLNGYAVSRGISISAAHNFPGPFMYSLGATLQDVFRQENGTKSPLLYAPAWSGVFSLSYTFEHFKTAVDWTARVTGRMQLPEYPGYSGVSEVYTEQNVKFSRPFGSGFEGFISVQNIFNYTQSDPLVAPDRPFSDDFATDRVFGPLQGRRLLAGIRYVLN